MEILTSYFANIRNLPNNVEPIAICTLCPVGYNGKKYKCLAPSSKLLLKWKKDKDINYYIQHFQEEVLNKLNISCVIMDLINLAAGKIPCLICYEKPSDFCHRHLVAEWLREIPNVYVKEFKKEEK